jgi:hypothetical protein
LENPNYLGSITKEPQATLGLMPSCFEKWSNIGWMNRIYGPYSWLNFVHFTKRQLESKFESLENPKLSWINHKRPASYTWVEA